ncbi:hypothetical protein K488DRAFT_48713 [Vararia minispora EC-137]|uniref:Uncharacterized protein n=1 Tax=Vararia minispora EC-137 TaxID=1314806 RepID=A0ACB8QM88_9AGAM|nr:hypothetical protein K488DRAFT_48713 [Vararia minispora EC-137]
MDSNSTTLPPSRVLVHGSQNISNETARETIDAFLADFEMRASTGIGGDNHVSVQLQKLSAALRHEAKRAKKVKGED